MQASRELLGVRGSLPGFPGLLRICQNVPTLHDWHGTSSNRLQPLQGYFTNESVNILYMLTQCQYYNILVLYGQYSV